MFLGGGGVVVVVVVLVNNFINLIKATVCNF